MWPWMGVTRPSLPFRSGTLPAPSRCWQSLLPCSPTREAAIQRISRAMRAQPEMVDGTGGFTTNLMGVAGDNIVSKSGAEGLFCAGALSQGWGIAVRIRGRQRARASRPGAGTTGGVADSQRRPARPAAGTALCGCLQYSRRSGWRDAAAPQPNGLNSVHSRSAAAIAPTVPYSNTTAKPNLPA